MKRGKVLVIGAGVIGLTTALTLAEHGYRITILSEEFVACDNESKLTSQVGPALWNIARMHGCEEKLKSWCLHSYHKFSRLAENPAQTGVYVRERVYMFPHMINNAPASKSLKDNLKDFPGFRHSDELLKEKGVSMECGLVDAMSVQVPMIEVDLFMMWLTQQCISKGMDFIKESLHSLSQNCDILRRKYQVDWMVNCTGISAGRLVQDEAVYPKLGTGLILRNDDRTFDFPNCALTVHGQKWHQEKTQTTGRVFIAPRGEHSLWFGTMELQSYDKNIDMHHPAVQRMIHECQTVYPPLRNINQEHLRLIVGIRPMRKGGPRVEQDPHCQFLIHNYGHASLGVMTSWGSAEDVLRIVEKSLSSNL